MCGRRKAPMTHRLSPCERSKETWLVLLDENNKYENHAQINLENQRRWSFNLPASAVLNWLSRQKSHLSLCQNVSNSKICRNKSNYNFSFDGFRANLQVDWSIQIGSFVVNEELSILYAAAILYSHHYILNTFRKRYCTIKFFCVLWQSFL